MRTRTGFAANFVRFSAAAAFIGIAGISRVEALELSNTPLFLGGAVEPNIMLVMDDSGSMAMSFLVDDISDNVKFVGGVYVYQDAQGRSTRRRALAYEWNQLAYNPFVTYVPPPTPGNEATQLPASSFTSAPRNGYLSYTNETCASSARTVRLDREYRPTWGYGDNCDSTDQLTGTLPEYWGPAPTSNTGAFYFIHMKDYWGTLNNTNAPDRAQCTNLNDLTNDACYVQVNVGNSSGPSVNPDERQNFANWYTYYRTRLFSAKAGIARAFSKLGTGTRVGLGRLNADTAGPVDSVSTTTVTNGVRKFSGSARQTFLSNVYAVKVVGSEAATTADSPIRRAVDDVGQYFSRTDDLGPWGALPGTGGGSQLACRKSFQFLMTDGYWNGAAASTTAANANTDGTAGPSITGPSGQSFSNPAVGPFSDSVSGTLADVAMYYWENDLRSDLANKVPPGTIDTAFWQHLTTYAIGIGVGEGNIDPATAFAAIKTQTSIPWPSNTDFAAWTVRDKVDDFLHAAVNSRGAFLDIRNSTAVDAALGSLLRVVIDETSSAASVVLNSGALFSDESNLETLLYQVIFDSGDWSGDVIAYSITQDGSLLSSVQGGYLKPVAKWRASEQVPGSRNIATVNTSTGGAVGFSWANLSTAQQTAIGPKSSLVTPAGVMYTGEELVAYLRGSSTAEQKNGGGLRNRPSSLGDIVNSAPVYLGAPKAPYPDSWCQILDFSGSCAEPESGYLAFRYNSSSAATNPGYADRTPYVFVGANDGMLHAFNATTGVEKFAFIPSAVIGRLSDLADPNYTHRYYADGSPVVGDAWLGSTKRWRTILTAGLNAGGRAIYALDVTDADTVTSDSIAASKVLWEFTAANDPDLGYTFSRPNIIRLEGGVWVVLFGNGYNSAETPAGSGKAVLFGLNAATGAVISKLKIPVSDPLNNSNNGRPNGLSTVAPVDINGDYNVDFVYAGDLYGNLWKFNLGISNPTATLLFKAQATLSDTPQPITTRPQVIAHPSGQGRIVLFGTGKYIEVGDSTNVDVQSFYGIWDNDVKTEITRADLQPQTILQEDVVTVSGKSVKYRVTSANSVAWKLDANTGSKYGWYMDLRNPNGNTYGERQVSDSVLRNDRIIFTTLLPSDDVCDFGGDSWLMELDAATGARPVYSPFDVNGDGVFTLDQLASTNNGDAFQVGDKKVSASGKKSTAGIMPTPAILARPEGRKEYKYASSSKSAEIQVTVENPGEASDSGRQGWMQLFRQ